MNMGSSRESPNFYSRYFCRKNLYLSLFRITLSFILCLIMPQERVIYLVRHGERIDNIKSNGWRKQASNEFKRDNPYLSDRGHQQCAELAKWFKKVDVDHVFASPFDRTLDTATRMIADLDFPIKPEGGFLEALYLCEFPPGVRSLETLKAKYPLFDENYQAVINPWNGFKREPVGDDGCEKRVRQTIEHVLNNYDGNIVIVSHGAPIGALLEYFTGKWTYVGQATVSKIIDKNGSYKAEYISNADHLSDKSDLRPW